jgi:thymidine phosphorylase
VLRSPADGVLTRLDALGVGRCAWLLGAGRARQDDPVQPGAGVQTHVKPGESVRAGQPLCTLHTDTPEALPAALAALAEAVAVEPVNAGRTAADQADPILARIV